MVCTVEKNEKNVATVKIEIDKEIFEKGIQAAYNKSKHRFVIDGFRKGKAPRNLIERKYGKSIFYEDAVDEAFPEAYTQCLEEQNFTPCAAPRLLSIDAISEDGAVLTVEIALEPEFEIAQYKGVKTGPIEYTLNDEDLEAELKALQEQNARLVSVDTAAENGDTVTIDFEGFLGDTPFEGGKAENYPLILGSGTFIPGFEEQLAGKKAQDALDVAVTFPENYHAEDLAGKEAVFKVKVVDVKKKELTPLDDDFAMDLGYDDLAGLKEDAAAKLKDKKNKALRAAAEQKIVGELIEKTHIDIPPQLLVERARSVRDNYEARLKSSGIDPEMYYRYVLETSENKDENQFAKMFEMEALTEIKAELIVKKVIALENIEATEEDLEAEYAKFAESGKQSLEEFKASLNEYTVEYVKNLIVQNKAYDFLIENAGSGE